MPHSEVYARRPRFQTWAWRWRFLWWCAQMWLLDTYLATRWYWWELKLRLRGEWAGPLRWREIVQSAEATDAS
jgi:hypothetical protein